MDDVVLQELLRVQRTEGAWDSEGVFTTVAGKALSKLAAYQLPRPSAWILKMVQAAVAGSCTGLRFDPDSDSSVLTLSFRGGELGELKELAHAWTSPTATVSLAQKHLLVGLRAVSISQKREVRSIEVDTEGRCYSLFWNGKALSNVTEQRRLRAPDEPLITFSVRGIKETYFWEKELSELREFAVACPIPLYLGSELLGFWGMEEHILLRKPLLSETVAKDDRDDILAWTLYRHNLTARNVISWVQYGVVCQEEEFGSKDVWQLRVFLSADSLETDLTGLHLRFTKPFSAPRRAGAAIEKVLEQLSTDSEKINKAVAVLHDNESFGVWTLITMGMVVSVTLIPVFSVFALGIGAAGGAFFHSAYQRNQKKEFRVSTRELLGWCERQLQNRSAKR